MVSSLNVFGRLFIYFFSLSLLSLSCLQSSQGIIFQAPFSSDSTEEFQVPLSFGFPFSPFFLDILNTSLFVFLPLHAKLNILLHNHTFISFGFFSISFVMMCSTWRMDLMCWYSFFLMLWRLTCWRVAISFSGSMFLAFLSALGLCFYVFHPL